MTSRTWRKDERRKKNIIAWQPEKAVTLLIMIISRWWSKCVEGNTIKKKCELLWVDVNFKRTKNCFFLTRKSVFLYSVNSLFLSLHNISFVKSVPLLSFQHLFYRNTISFSVIFFSVPQLHFFIHLNLYMLLLFLQLFCFNSVRFGRVFFSLTDIFPFQQSQKL